MLSFLTWPLTLGSLQIAAAATISLPITTYTISDSKSPLAVYYGQKPTVFSPNITGLFSYQLPALDNAVRAPGDLKSVTTLYSSLEDYVVTLVVEDSLLSVTSLRTQRSTSLKLWGDYSAVCAVGSSLVYIFGKGVAKVVMVEFGQIREVRYLQRDSRCVHCPDTFVDCRCPRSHRGRSLCSIVLWCGLLWRE